MTKNKSIRRISNKKRGRPKVRFSIWGLLLIFVLSFTTCFILYMVAANYKDDFFSEEFDNVVIEEKSGKSSSEKNKNDEAEKSVQDGSLAATNPISQSDAKDASYLEGCCMITDTTLQDMAKYTGLKDIISSPDLGASNCTSATIESSYGVKTVYEIAQIKKPETVYIMLGNDIGTAKVDDMISSYTELIKNLRGYLPNSDIYIMQYPPVRDDDPSVSNSNVNEFNTKLLTIANTNNVYCIDTNTALKGVDGNLSDEFRDLETGVLTESAYKTIADYILCHTV